MSPVSVAQFLRQVRFRSPRDRQANQLRPEDALGLVARCRRIVVVGDNKLLPPARFFDRMIAIEADSGNGKETTTQHKESAVPITDLDSILSLCESRGLESRTLRWPTRSRHPSPIEVSNVEF
jgi:superfamily I DNA and/or RNA helicase